MNRQVTHQHVGRLSGPARVVVVAGPQAGVCRDVISQLVIGRAEGCGLMLEDAGVSRRHAEIKREAGGWAIEDLDSRNGTRVNGVPIRHHQLQVGDTLQLGPDVSLLFTDRSPVEGALIERQRFELLGRMAAGVAHDFNNVLGVVAAAAGFLRDQGGAHEESLSCVEDLEAAVSNGTLLANRLMRFARGSQGRSQVDLADVCREVAQLCRRSFGASIRVEVDCALGLLVQADEGELHQVVLNLCVNARDAMKEGGAIRLSARRDDDAAGPRLCLVVEDCGAGIAPSEIHRIFEPFFSTKGEAGFGLGLATVKELVTLHGGTVEVRSELGKGTAFTIRLPAHSESHGRPRLATRWPASAHIGAGKQVLLVDDEPLVRRSTARLLARSGFSVTEAEDGLQACALVRKGQRIDVLLVDLDMPGMNGLATIRELRRELPRLPALMVSGHNTPAAQQQARAEGADFLAKPFSPRGLLEAVTAVLAAQPSACRPTEDSTVWQTIPDTGSYHWRGKPEG